MNVFWVVSATPMGTIAPEQEKVFRDATVVYVGATLSVIRDKLVYAYLLVRVAKDLWEALKSKFGATDARSARDVHYRTVTITKWLKSFMYWNKIMR